MISCVACEASGQPEPLLAEVRSIFDALGAVRWGAQLEDQLAGVPQ